MKVKIDISDLKHNKSGKDYEDGYRIVYFNNDTYEIGEYCKTIEGFMIGFAECNPIMSEDDIPNFISNKDLLNRYLESVNDIDGVAIYDVNGNCIEKYIL